MCPYGYPHNYIHETHTILTKFDTRSLYTWVWNFILDVLGQGKQAV